MEARCKTPVTLRSTATLTFLAFFVGSVATLVLVSYLPHSVYFSLTSRNGGLHALTSPLVQGVGSGEPAYVARQRSYKAILPKDARRRGLSYLGSGKRMDRFATKLATGQPVKVVALGGSVTAGAGALSPAHAYPARFLEWVNATFPHPGHQLVNRGIGATSSGIFALCAERMMPTDPDLVIVEFSFNDPLDLPYDHPARKGFEILLRKLLMMPTRPAVVVMHHFSWWFARPPYTKRGGIYWFGAETQLSVFAQYYDIPSVSLKAATYHLMRKGTGNFKIDKVLHPEVPYNGIASAKPGTPGQSFYADLMHPTDFGHSVMAELLNELTWQSVLRVTPKLRSAAAATAAGMLSFGADAAAAGEEGQTPSRSRALIDQRAAGGAARAAAATTAASGDRDPHDLPPWRKGGGQGVVPPKEKESVKEREKEKDDDELPSPMVYGNADVTATTCYLQNEFMSVVVDSLDFEYAAARPNATTWNAQKWAWTGTEPGAWVEMQVDTREDPSHKEVPAKAPLVSLILGHLKSYESMGAAYVQCVSGCACEDSVIEGTWDRRATLMQMHEFKVTQHEQCRVRVTILQETFSGKHKISLTFLLVAPFPISSEAYDGQMESIATGAVFGSGGG